MRRLAVDTFDISKDPYIVKNHIGSFECRLCLTLHSTEASYLAHTQGKKHQTNLARRQAKDAKDAQATPQPRIRPPKRRSVKIGRPGYRVTKQKEADTGQKALLFELEYPQIEPKVQPRFRVMSAYEQKQEQPDDRYQYILVAAEPYETVAFKVPNLEIDFNEGKHFTHWDADKHQYSLRVTFKEREKKKPASAPAPPAAIGPQPKFPAI